MNSIQFDIENPSASLICSATVIGTPTRGTPSRKTYFARAARPLNIVGALHAALRRGECEFGDIWNSVAWVDVLECPDFSDAWRSGWQKVYMDQLVTFNQKLAVFAAQQNLNVRRVFDISNGQDFTDWLNEVQDFQRQHKHPQGLI